MSCPYILQFNGAFYHNGVPAIVTPWMPYGSIAEYLERHADVGRLRLVSSSEPQASDISPFLILVPT